MDTSYENFRTFKGNLLLFFFPQKLLTFDQHRRICARDALCHPYILDNSLHGDHNYLQSPGSSSAGCHSNSDVSNSNSVAVGDGNGLSLSSPDSLSATPENLDALISHEEIVEDCVAEDLSTTGLK